ncbi:hypothetical protein [Streptomyces acidicola]|uniref:hypothetical protein n=1 Tax=Streptomyces acidicola TaxID=2596892 RepID=UPI0034304DA0
MSTVLITGSSTGRRDVARLGTGAEADDARDLLRPAAAVAARVVTGLRGRWAANDIP